MKGTYTMSTEKPPKFDAQSAREYAEIAQTVFAPIYPVIAEQILKKCRKTEGICMDVGCGPASLGVALARMTSLKIFGLDYSGEILALARKNLSSQGMDNRIDLIEGDIHHIPFRPESADLVVSRGSLGFWKEQAVAFKEIHRVLKPGGMGYIGGGLGSAELAEKINREMEKRENGWKGRPKKSMSGKRQTERVKRDLESAGFREYDIFKDDSGFWISFKKGKDEPV
jgi:ubiquinone/menaquinone biosynthesis C-methylase UbiE